MAAGYTFALSVISSLAEGFSLALPLPSLKPSGIDIGPCSEVGRFVTLVGDGFGAIELRPPLAPMSGPARGDRLHAHNADPSARRADFV